MRNIAMKRSVLKKYIRHKLMTDPDYRKRQLHTILIHSEIPNSRIRNNLWAIVYGKSVPKRQNESDGKIALRYWRYIWNIIRQNNFAIEEEMNQAMKVGFLKPGRDNNAIADVIGNLV